MENWVLTQETSIKDLDEKLSLTKKENVVNNDDVSVEELRLKVIQLEKGMAKVDDKKQNNTTTIKCKECVKAFQKLSSSKSTWKTMRKINNLSVGKGILP